MEETGPEASNEETLEAAKEAARDQYLAWLFPEEYGEEDERPEIRPGDGNIFGVMGAARESMRKARIPRERIEEMMERVQNTATGYHDAMAIILEYVRIRR